MRYDLGGVGHQPDGRLSVNLAERCDIQHDFLDLDGFIHEDGAAEEFYLSHALEHVPVEKYVPFLRALHRKLRPEGRVVVVQTDVGGVIKLWLSGQLTFRAARTTIFTPASRIRVNPYHRHHNMWTADELARDFEEVGFRAQTFEAGSWAFDIEEELAPAECQRCFGVPIPNLGVIAVK